MSSCFLSTHNHAPCFCCGVLVIVSSILGAHSHWVGPLLAFFGSLSPPSQPRIGTICAGALLSQQRPREKIDEKTLLSNLVPRGGGALRVFPGGPGRARPNCRFDRPSGPVQAAAFRRLSCRVSSWTRWRLSIGRDVGGCGWAGRACPWPWPWPWKAPHNVPPSTASTVL